MNLLDKIKSIFNIGDEESEPTNTTAATDGSSYESNSSDPSGNGTVDNKSDAETTVQSETGSAGIPDVEEAEADVGMSEEPPDNEEAVVTTGGETELENETEADTETAPEAASEDIETEAETNGAASETDETTTEKTTTNESGESDPVDVIKGVGTTYAERLGEAGIETVADLAAADPEAIADETDISAKRIERWVGRAEHR